MVKRVVHGWCPILILTDIVADDLMTWMVFLDVGLRRTKLKITKSCILVLLLPFLPFCTQLYAATIMPGVPYTGFVNELSSF